MCPMWTGLQMKASGEYAGVELAGIDPVQIAAGYGVEGALVDDESRIGAEIDRELDLVEREKRPYLLDVKLPLGLPSGATAAEPYQAAGD